MAGNFFQEDVERITADINLPWDNMQDACVLVSGATGQIGSILIRVLRAASNRHRLNLSILGTGRNTKKSVQLVDEYGANSVIDMDIRKSFPAGVLPEKLDYIFHCAAITKSADMISKPYDVITTEVLGTRNVLEVAQERGCLSFVYLSSMEVYGQTELDEVCETDLGYLDLSSPRSSYPESKRLCEALCSSGAVQNGIPVKIARLARIFGAGIPYDDSDQRVAMLFAREAVAGEDIVLHTTGQSMANCCYTADAISGLLYILLKGKNCETYNIANPQASATVHEMARTVADVVFGGKINVAVEVPQDIVKRGYATDVGYRLNAEKLRRLGWNPQYGLADMYHRMIADWRQAQ